MNKYHAHIYFSASEEALIQRVHAAAQLKTQIMKTFRIVPYPVGPHPMGMFEVHFTESTKKEVLKWFEEHRQGLNVLIHIDSGDDYRDHTENVIWLGEKLPLDFSFFDLVKNDPSKALHK